jgi:hypothetical protein
MYVQAKKKRKKPYKLSPKPYCSMDITTSKGYMLIWTDGSAKDATPKQYKEFKRPAKKIAFSIYYNENSILNRGKRCKYATNSLEAELEAIEYALCKAPTNYNLMIITDCQSAISLINKQSKADK